ncbi:MAG: DUF3632 domain-containing protein [Deltaproteobacteria bacterium]|nr:DUF3632 domain-containing protein [Deltaproteobacteria bacterium]
MSIDVERAYAAYGARFTGEFGDKPLGAFVKFGSHMVQHLSQTEFAARLTDYLSLHAAVREILESGSTISDIVMLEYDEAAAWICIRAPNLLDLFKGELGDENVALGS